MTEIFDVAVVGAGNAALSAAIAAAEAGRRVVLIERAPMEESGGNSRYAAGAFRFTYAGAQDIRELVPDLTDEELAFGREHWLRASDPFPSWEAVGGPDLAGGQNG